MTDLLRVFDSFPQNKLAESKNAHVSTVISQLRAKVEAHHAKTRII